MTYILCNIKVAIGMGSALREYGLYRSWGQRPDVSGTEAEYTGAGSTGIFLKVCSWCVGHGRADCMLNGLLDRGEKFTELW